MLLGGVWVVLAPYCVCYSVEFFTRRDNIILLPGRCSKIDTSLQGTVVDMSVHGAPKGVRGMTDTSADATIIKTEVLGSLARYNLQRLLRGCVRTW